MSENIPDGYVSSHDAQAEQLRQKWAERRAYWAGVAVSNVIGLLTILATQQLLLLANSSSPTSNVAGIWIASQILGIPLGMGFVASFFWRKLDLKSGALFGGAVWITIVGLFGTAIVLHEGAICLLMASPLLILFIWLGAALGKLLWARSPWLGASVLPVLLLMLAGDMQAPHHHAAIVKDEIRIAAPPARVWRYIAAYPTITAPPDFWLWKIGVPFPTQSTAEGAFIGARRDCRFTSNVVFQEKIVAARTARELTFIVTKQPDHPELTGHFNLDRGRFELRDNGDGSTTLVGTTWYRLHVYPTQYFDLWAAAIIRNVHLRVFQQIKELSERDV